MSPEPRGQGRGDAQVSAFLGKEVGTPPHPSPAPSPHSGADSLEILHLQFHLYLLPYVYMYNALYLVDQYKLVIINI